MGSTFNGLEVAKRAMYAQQSALYTTGHNISNANTPGYSRQRVNFEQTAPYPPASRNRPEIPGQVGSGVEAGTIERVRESFLDAQYRGENTKAGYWSTKAEALQKMEEIMNEPSENGLSKTMDQFWQSLQDLSTNPKDEGARSVVRQRGTAVAETFNYLSDSLQGIQTDFKNQIDITAKDISSIAKQIKDINDQIGDVEPHGYLPNDLYDKRDQLVDELSELVDIKVSTVETSDSSLEIAEGKYTIEIIGASEPLVDGKNNSYRELDVVYASDGADGEDADGPVTKLAMIDPKSKDDAVTSSLSGASLDALGSGKLKGLMESYGYKAEGAEQGIYPDMLTELDKLAAGFADSFNSIHKSGLSLNEMNGVEDEDYDGNFFTKSAETEGYAGSMAVASGIKNDLFNIAAEADGNDPTLGGGENAIKLGEASDSIVIDGKTTSFNSYYEGMIGEMAVESQEARRLEGNSETLKQSVEERRQSVSGVSLDEEMSNIIKYQHAYNAAARNLTTIDEMLDKIINGMGRVGR
ncbi:MULTISPECIES: flagellar hook-associated protein FlgK [Pontibacillus]|uniref:Flagellar hook-associated protein 1 n=1 Tax=Pontibacillus chungwhensis TaxID=265426 RepID=A0ABY8UVC5_9BACI|nr:MULTISPECIES: flagellar hook-associated protein FlgK [Pontibacillus]MCD5325912.1 flagellar hook-associated protein FlgK [Pontibacillus sp. HN14]WIF97622.1 flagellar hook-associated protein FlgK [Pontibacillus chungwhensis]